MKTNSIIIPVLVAVLAVSCTQEDTVPAPFLESSVNVVYVPSEGGSYNIGYVISNPVSGGVVSCRREVSWLSDIDVSVSGLLFFTVEENGGESLRGGNIVLTYTYSGGYVEKRFGISQDGTAMPSLSLSSTAMTVPEGGGDYSFEFTVVNPASDGEISCSTKTSWLSLRGQSDGAVSFSVEGNDTARLREGEISLTYTYSSYKTLTETFTVVQDRLDEGFERLSSITGTYSAEGYAYVEGTASDDEWQTWVMKIYPYSSTEVIIDGLTPSFVGQYPTTDIYAVRAYLDSDGRLVIPAQFTGGILPGLGYYIGYLVCSDYSSSVGWTRFYDNCQPDCVLTLSPETGVWTSDYGMFCGGFSTMNVFTDFVGFVDVTNPGFSITKTGEI